MGSGKTGHFAGLCADVADADAEQRAETGEIHIVGLVVHARFAQIDAVAGAIRKMPGAEIHAISEQGKLVVTLEGCSSDAIAGTLQSIHALPGVYSASLVYQHHEDAESLNEELVDEADPPRVHQTDCSR